MALGAECAWLGGSLGALGTGHILVTAQLLPLSSVVRGAQPTPARGKWPNVNSSFWRRDQEAAVVFAGHEMMNRDLEKGRRRSSRPGGRETGP